jgi:ATP-binding cassette subfamily F protein 3
VADRIIAVADGRARVIEGDYETYQSLMQREAESAAPTSSRPQAATTAAQTRATAPDLPLPPTAQSGKRRRRFPYRKPAEIEREIGEKESALATLQAALGDPDTYRDAARARDVQARFESTQADLARLYEHWDEALELNT